MGNASLTCWRPSREFNGAHHLQIIGEAASKLSEEFRDAHREIAWPQIVAMRNVIAHEYFGIDLDTVWQVVERDLPELTQKLNTIEQAFTFAGKT